MEENKSNSKDGTFFHPKLGRVVVKKGRSMRIHWNQTMIDYLKRNFATTLNDELAEWLGVSLRTMVRKARELGLQKDRQWLVETWNEHCRLGNIISKRKGYPGCFKTGTHNNPEGEFKPGHKLSPEAKKKRTETLNRLYWHNPSKKKEWLSKMQEGKRAKKDRQNAKTLQP
jgi:hypothetical protein